MENFRFKEQYKQLQTDVENKKVNQEDRSVKFYRGRFLSLQSDGLNIIIDFDKCTVEGYVEVNYMNYGEKQHTFDNMKELYDILYFEYKKYFPTYSLASKTIVWIKQKLT